MFLTGNYIEIAPTGYLYCSTGMTGGWQGTEIKKQNKTMNNMIW